MRTHTLGAEQAIITILEGHHDANTFNRFFGGEREYTQSLEVKTWDDWEISHEYWIKEKDGSWTCSTKEDPRAIPVTVGDW